MFRFPDGAMAAGLFLVISGAAVADESGHGIGRVATPEEVAAWDIDVRPDGHGLPEGSGTVAMGEKIYLEQCAVCHGEFGEGADRYPQLMGGFDTLTSEDPRKTVGSYWPYATTLWDYIYRAMPFGDAQSLSGDEVYALTAYVLYLNEVVDENASVDRTSLPQISMPNRDGFIADPRPDVPRGEPCVSNCRQQVTVVSRAKSLAVTPDRED